MTTLVNLDAAPLAVTPAQLHELLPQLSLRLCRKLARELGARVPGGRKLLVSPRVVQRWLEGGEKESAGPKGKPRAAKSRAA